MPRVLLAAIVLVAFTFLVITPLAGFTAFTYFARDLPSPQQVVNQPVPQTTKIYDRNGVLLAEIGDPNQGRRTVVRLDQLPANLINATVATEDPTFFTNPGVDVQSILRATFQNAAQHQITSGASTITQQLARNLLWSLPERESQSITRKIEEAIFAYRLTQAYPKDDILAMYFNTVYYGNQSYGVEAAAETYFGISASKLDLAQAALLAGLPQAPSDYDPFQNLTLAKQRQAQVLAAMVKRGYITTDQADAANREPLPLKTPQIPYNAPHFVNYVTQWLQQRYGYNAVYDNGWQIQTSLDLHIDQMAQQDEQALIQQVKQTMNAHDACVVAISPQTGEILAMVGSPDYWDASINGQVNTCTSPRQGGSSVKPFNYLAAFERGFVPSSLVNDSRTEFPVGPGLPTFVPSEFTNTYNGTVTLREALGSSLNVPAVKLLQYVGDQEMADTAHAMGVTTMTDPYRYGLTLTLGASDVTAIDMAFAYSVLANGGQMVGEPVPLQDRQLGMRQYEPVAVLKITDSAGNVIYQYEPPKPIQVVSPQATFLISNVLSDDAARHFDFGSHGALWLGYPAAVKTGTTQFYQDTWADGYVPGGLAVAIWVGNADATPMTNTFSLLTAAALWHSFVPAAVSYLHLPIDDFPVPPGVVHGQVCGKEDWYIQGIPAICSVG
jgi:membrane peptidoglycan carboxypeptidase